MNAWIAFLKWRRQRRFDRATPAQRAGRLQKAADSARNRGDWVAASQGYRAAIDANPPNGALSLQLGHALKEAGDAEGAVGAYQAATQDASSAAEGQLYLGHTLVGLRRLDRAVDAYAACLDLAPATIDARNALVRLDARDRLPESQFDRTAAERALASAAATTQDAIEAYKALSQASIFPVSAWDRFTTAYPVAPPPNGLAGGCRVIVDARGLPAWAIRTTLDSLADQTMDWVACVLTSESDDHLGHPVAAAAAMDQRITFHTEVGSALPAQARDPMVMVSAGTLLEASALAWLAFAGVRGGARLVHADHDRFRQDWRLGRVRYSPSLFATPDRNPPEQQGETPAMIWVEASQQADVAQALAHTGLAARQTLIQAAAAHGPVAHLPRVLASIAEGIELAAVGVNTSPLATDPGDATITVVIPTHSQPALLTAALQSLFAMAHRPDRLSVVIVENRATPETRAAAARLAERAGVETLTADEPFNWSRLNALGAEGRSSDLLVFMNDDVALLTQDWDARLRTHLQRPDVGVVGARLFYPDGTIQHAGIVFGQDENGPAHEGVGAARSDGGPLNRWRTTHAASAITGAFLGCRRDTHDAVGGFDTRFAVGFNDIDFCLKVRAAGLDVLYAADIEAEHHESPSRGLNNTPDRVRWDRDELFDLHQKWGDALFIEPGVNPHWASSVGRPYDGYREPRLSEILAHLDRSATAHPWSAAAR